MSKSKNKKSHKQDESGKVFLLDKFVCNYITTEWLSDGASNLSHSKKYGVHRHILTKIKKEDGYRIPLSSLAIMCFYKKIALSDFFKMIENKYGSKINDDFVVNTKKEE
ncbi:MULTISPECIES: hypothetical protein [Flavivirga]|uniref:Transcriptional regulator n=2 Tax=Flavivirga TaxID=1209327 RepID=A0ABX1RR67_9FLAO|nr:MULTISPECIES: hypothetical protein [Flavivirga]MDO5973874.1 hypothetical protein [Flavivirga jejuensis]NMH86042.1 hypothetical protein [Flavivirga algicola]